MSFIILSLIICNQIMYFVNNITLLVLYSLKISKNVQIVLCPVILSFTILDIIIIISTHTQIHTNFLNNEILNNDSYYWTYLD